jgi:hypothetical protein
LQSGLEALTGRNHVDTVRLVFYSSEACGEDFPRISQDFRMSCPREFEM